MKTEKNFIVFEGLDGSGKGTQMKILKEHYKSISNKNVLFTFEPTSSSVWSDKIREIIKNRDGFVPMKDLQLLFILDRKQHIADVIMPNLENGKIVFSDRYFLSTLVYGSLDKKIHWKTLLDYHKQIMGDNFIFPSKIIFLDVPVDIAMSRINFKGSEKTIFETKERLKNVREAYLRIGPHFEGFEVVDGTGSAEEVFEEMRVILKEYL